MTPENQAATLKHVRGYLAHADTFAYRIELEEATIWLEFETDREAGVFGKTKDERYYFQFGISRRVATWRATGNAKLTDLTTAAERAADVRQLAGGVLMDAISKWIDSHPNAPKKAEYEYVANSIEMNIDEDHCDMSFGIVQFDHAGATELINTLTKHGRGRAAGKVIAFARMAVDVKSTLAAEARRARKQVAGIRG